MSVGELPFGCRDCKIWAFPRVDASYVDVPRIRTVELNVTRDSTTLEGDDVKIATHTFAKGLDGSIESGGVNTAVLEILEGGDSSTTSGVTTYVVQGTDVEGYFVLEAQMYADDGGDFHFTAWKVKATNGPNYSFQQGEFALTACDIEGIFDDSVNPSRLYRIVQNTNVTVIDIT